MLKIPVRRQCSGVSLATAVTLALAWAAADARGQADFVESFDSIGTTQSGQDGPSELIARGWAFRNQSSPLGALSWFPGYTGDGWPPPQSGTGYLAVSSSSTDFFGGRVSNWAILPAIPNQASGDVVTFYTYNSAGERPTQLHVLYSPTGGTDTGSGPDEVGDFTEPLLSLSPIPVGGWYRHTVAVPGAGRIAFRYYIEDACNWSCGGAYTGIDNLSVGVEPPPPCNLPPVPSPGQTVTWAAADSPYRVCQNIGIPAGATVNVEPGVVVDFDGHRQLTVSGTLNLNGTAGSPVVLRGVDEFPPFIVVQGGTLEGRHAEFGQQLNVRAGATVRLFDSVFADNAGQRGFLVASPLQDPEPFVHLERCTFIDSGLGLTDCRSILRDNTFIRTSPGILRGYADITAPNTFEGAPLSITLEDAIQPFFVDGVEVSNAPGAGLVLGGGWNFFIGPNTSLQGNAYPVEIEGGLLPGSAVPLSGNATNKILASAVGMVRRWPDLGLPYVLSSTTDGGGLLTIDPGVTVEARPGTGWTFVLTNGLIADGTPAEPITFRGEDGVAWRGLQFVHNHGSRLEYILVEDADFAVVSSDVPALYLQNSTLRGNSVGGNVNTFGGLVVEKTRVLGNGAGFSVTDLGNLRLTGGSKPNAFEGNLAAIDAFEPNSDAEAPGNWWGHPTGPGHPQNPGGLGDPIVGPGAANVAFLPFLTAPPDFADTPAVVRMLDPGFRTFEVGPDRYFEPGEKVILSWTAADDAGVASQSIRVATEGHTPDAFDHAIAEGLDGAARSFEMVVPDVGFAATAAPQYVRITATDGAGQEGWDETPITISSMRITGELTITTDMAGVVLHPGDEIPPVTWTGSVTGSPGVTPFLLLEADGGMIAAFPSGSFFEGAPHASTDAARLALRVRNNSNDVRWFVGSGYFTIRHDPRFGLEPPQVHLQTPAPGASFPGGAVVPVSWTGSDADDGLRSFDIQASFNGGKTWRFIARDLPPSARSFDWELPPSTGIPDVRVRVIARDLRFQNSTSGHDRVFSIQPGAGCRADLDGSGTLTVADFVAFRNLYLANDQRADFDSSGDLTPNDFVQFRNAYIAGCA